MCVLFQSMADGMIFQVIKVKVQLLPPKTKKFRMETPNNRPTNNKLKRKRASKLKTKSK